jgi:hypothetical protein
VCWAHLGGNFAAHRVKTRYEEFDERRRRRRKNNLRAGDDDEWDGR